MKRKEKRIATRVQVPLAGIVTFEAKGKGLQTLQVVAKDVSEDGTYLWVDAPTIFPRAGDKVGINLSCSSDLKRVKLSMEAAGIVTRVSRPKKGQPGFAVKFEEVPIWGKGLD